MHEPITTGTIPAGLAVLYMRRKADQKLHWLSTGFNLPVSIEDVVKTTGLAHDLLGHEPYDNSVHGSDAITAWRYLYAINNGGKGDTAEAWIIERLNLLHKPVEGKASKPKGSRLVAEVHLPDAVKATADERMAAMRDVVHRNFASNFPPRS